MNFKDTGSKQIKEFEVICFSNPQRTERIASQAVLRVLPFSPRSVNGKTYLVSQADVSVETPFGTPRKSVGLIFDQESGWEYALTIDNFNQFMETGNPSLLPKKSRRSSRVKTVQLKEICLPTEKAS
jgi:hypothetical protein